MKSKRAFPRMVVNKKAEASLRNGHPWVYGAEVVEKEPAENGAISDVFSEKGTYLGSGFYNEQSKILVRVLSKNANDAFDEAFSAAASATPSTTARPSWARTSTPAASSSERRTGCPAGPWTGSRTCW